ncbi:MAG: hypothetical protein Q4D56_08550 [Bacteroides sp.]|nr:hypothetical protein [Bacteroides sp.]
MLKRNDTNQEYPLTRHLYASRWMYMLLPSDIYPCRAEDAVPG